MTIAQVDSTLLVSEIAAFYAGFGQSAELFAALRSSTVVVPLIDEDQILHLHLGGLEWVCAFTGIPEWAQFTAARGVDSDREYRFHTMRGGRLWDYAAARERPTGVAVDVLGSAPMMFPPTVADDTVGAR